MHPELLNNSIFLRYYKKWQEDPTSIVFAPVAEYFMRYGMLEDAEKILAAGLNHHPRLVSAHVVFAKLMICKGEIEKAEHAVNIVLEIVPASEQARQLRMAIDATRKEQIASAPGVSLESMSLHKESTTEGSGRIPSWETVTMANIYSAQGHFSKAKKIYKAILDREPENEAAKRGLEYLANKGEAAHPA